MRRLVVFGLFSFLLFSSTAPVSADNPNFVCANPGSCFPVSGVTCQGPPPPASQPNTPGACSGTSGSYWNVASCDAFDHQGGGLNYFKRYYFRIRKNSSTFLCGSTSWAYSHTWSQSTSANTNVQPGSCAGFAGGGVPTGCNQGIQPPSGPTPTPTAGPPPPGCPTPYNLPPINCNIVPCAYKNSCGCTCSNPPCSPGQCTGGPPPTATPTPTPTPFCRLFCPGQEGLLGQLNGSGGGVGNIDFQPTPILPTQAVGFLQYRGYNGFACGTFDDAKTYPKICPVGVGGIGNLNDSWIYPTPTTNPLRYNMLCGNNTHIYTAIVNAGERSGTYGGGGQAGGPTPTTAPTPKLGLYPPGCVIGTPTPTPSGGIPNVSDQDAGFLKEQGGGLGSDSNSCSCSVAVGCQTTLQSLPSQTGSSCDPQCDFTVSPETPEFGEVTTFTPSGSGVDGTSTLSFDDNTDPVAANNGAVTHTFANSGVYKVALSCSSGAQICTRMVNNYCGPLSWYKIKNASFHKNSSLNDPIPASINPFDSDDTGESLVSMGSAGLVTTNGSITTGAGNLSTPNWRTTVYTPNVTYTPTAYADYVVSRKEYVAVVDGNSNGVIDSNEVTANKTNYIVGNYTIDNNSIQSNSPFVLIVRGNLIINIQGGSNEFNPPDKAITLIVTGTLKIHSHMDTLNGIFMATSTDLAYDVASSTTPLKIVGNLISQNSVDLKKRIRTNGTKPSFFVVQDLRQYMRVLDKVGIGRYTQSELRP